MLRAFNRMVIVMEGCSSSCEVVSDLMISCEAKLLANVSHPTFSRNMVTAKAGKIDSMGWYGRQYVSGNALELRTGEMF